MDSSGILLAWGLLLTEIYLHFSTFQNRKENCVICPDSSTFYLAMSNSVSLFNTNYLKVQENGILPINKNIPWKEKIILSTVKIVLRDRNLRAPPFWTFSSSQSLPRTKCFVDRVSLSFYAACLSLCSWRGRSVKQKPILSCLLQDAIYIYTILWLQNSTDC